MLRLYDYLPSQNAYKIRLLLNHLDIEYETVPVAIFEGEGKRPEFLAKNPVGAVPVLELEDGRTLPESNAILQYLAEGTPYLPADPWLRAQVARWMFFEEDYVQGGIASLRYLVMTGKAESRNTELIESKRALSLKTLSILDTWLAKQAFLVGDDYSIADMALYAYVGFSDEADLPMSNYPAVVGWVARVQKQPGFLADVYPYSIDPYSCRELP